MTDIADRIALILSSEPTSKAVADLIEAAKAESDRIATRREEVRAEAVDPLTPAATVKKRRGELVELEFDTERLTVAVGRLQEALQQAQERERQANRLARYQSARAAMEAAGNAISARWDTLAAEMRDLLLAGTEAVQAVAEANATLPEGAEPLDIHPALIGSVSGEPEKIVREREVQLWTYEATGALVPEANLEQGGDRRKVKGTTGSNFAVKRSFREVEYIPATDRQRSAPIYEQTELPSCTPGAPAFWEKGRNDWGALSIDAILDRARALEAQRQSFANPVPRTPQKRHLPLFNVEAERAAMGTVRPKHDVLEGQDL